MAVTSDDSPKFHGSPPRAPRHHRLAGGADRGRPGRPTRTAIVLLESDEDVLLYDDRPHPGRPQDRLAPRPQRPGDARLRRRRRFAEVMGRAASAATRPSSSTATRATGGRPTPCGSSPCSATRTSGCLDGGRAKWIAEGRELTRDVPAATSVDYPVADRDDAPIRAFKDDVLAHLGKPLVDVRSPGEYSGELLHMPDYPQEGAMRGGHIPGAKSVPWARAANDDGTFKSREELEAIYLTEQGLDADGRRGRLLPHRRALVAHVVRPDAPARVRRRPQLRRLVDRVGQRRARPVER